MRAKDFKIILNIRFRNITEQKDMEDILDFFSYQYNEVHNGSIKNPIEDMTLISVEKLD